ncbi:adenylate cyclase [Georgenia yuyongxinii]|uniref:Adenylate cyclase n=1 Tax=Georgenia yuyongxinii TaxID=2589797 RepID=A0A552WPD0_9MICO|nr:adenylate cyclase [Georgenia yuyongxinii]TRW44641.1 adenylate cyclase [Georgenia yuyongxinii]
MTTTKSQRLLSEDLVEVLKLMKDSDSVELKVTVPDTSYRSAAAALGADPLNGQIRQVFFFDTPDLRLNAAGVVARARRIQGRGDDSVVKLRPIVPSTLPAQLRQSPELVVEVDAMPGGYVCSATLKHLLPRPDVRPVVLDGKPLRKLFSKEQRAFFSEHAPEGLGLDDLSVLGPIFVLKLKLRPEGFPRKLVGEMWIYPDGSRVVELSTRCLPGEGLEVALEARTFLEGKGIPLSGDQQTKTKTALELFSAELQAQKNQAPTQESKAPAKKS